jgi:hypothetical protein
MSTIETPAAAAYVLPQVFCYRCDYRWTPDSETPPQTCANRKCRSPYWNRPRRKERQMTTYEVVQDGTVICTGLTRQAALNKIDNERRREQDNVCIRSRWTLRIERKRQS